MIDTIASRLPLLIDRRENGELICLLNLSTRISPKARQYLEPEMMNKSSRNRNRNIGSFESRNRNTDSMENTKMRYTDSIESRNRNKNMNIFHITTPNHFYLPKNYPPSQLAYPYPSPKLTYMDRCFTPLNVLAVEHQVERLRPELFSMASEVYANSEPNSNGIIYEQHEQIQKSTKSIIQENLIKRTKKLKSSPLKFVCCSEPKCENRARSRGLCKRHGGGTRCSEPSCDRPAQRQGKCPRHGGASKCIIPNCTKFSQSMGRCKAHGGGTLCAANGCTKNAYQNKMCRTHGGGSRCKLFGCKKWAQKLGFCCLHTKIHGSATTTYSV